MKQRLRNNTYASIPLTIGLALWLALLDTFQTMTASIKLLEHLGGIWLVLVYAVITAIVVLVPTVVVFVIISTLLDKKGRLNTSAHIGRVIGSLIFITMSGGGLLFTIRKSGLTNLFDPRVGFPVLALIIAGWVLAYLIGGYINRNYNPSNWKQFIALQFSRVIGTSVFVFVSFSLIYTYSRDSITRTGRVPVSIETGLIYLGTAIAGIIISILLLKIFRAVSRKSISLTISIFIGVLLIPLIFFLRPPDDGKPYKHNPSPFNIGENVILISIDTLRYDKLGCNGNPTIQTPNIDALASESLIFENCITPMPVTVPAHTTMLTGYEPNKHGVMSQIQRLSPDFLTLPERLSVTGFTCGGFISMVLLSNENSNLGQGFDYYDDAWISGEGRWFPAEINRLITRKIIRKILTGVATEPETFTRPAEKTIDSAMGWIDEMKDDDFFCFIHLFDAHWDYSAPEPYTEMYNPDYEGLKYRFSLRNEIENHKVEIDEAAMKYIESRYDGEVTYVDAQLGRLFSHLKEQGLWDKTRIVLTADHGESFEHDYFFNHGQRVWQSTIHVPLILKPPGHEHNLGRFNDQISLTDIPDFATGLFDHFPSLNPFYVRLHKYLISESYPSTSGQDSRGRMYSIISGNRKLIYSPMGLPYTPTYQLYDLDTDPGELYCLIDDDGFKWPDLKGIIRTFASQDPSYGNEQLDKSEREKLKSLQYLN